MVLNDHTVLHYLLADKGRGFSVHLLTHFPVDSANFTDSQRHVPKDHNVTLLLKDSTNQCLSFWSILLNSPSLNWSDLLQVGFEILVHHYKGFCVFRLLYHWLQTQALWNSMHSSCITAWPRDVLIYIWVENAPCMLALCLLHFCCYFSFWRLITLQYCGGFCHTFAWISHVFPISTWVPHPDPPSNLPPHPIPLSHPSAPALNTLPHASNLDWWSVSHKIIHIFQCHSPESSHPLPLP